MNSEMRVSTVVKNKHAKEVSSTLDALIKEYANKGYEISFGFIGNKTTYCLMAKGDEEIVGYTFIKDLKYKNETTGKLKALQQAIARKEVYDSKENN